MTTNRWYLRGSDAFEIDSKVIGDRIAVGVAAPDPAILAAFKARDRFDVVYPLDGTLTLSSAAAICLVQLADLIRPGFPPLLLVGLDYPEGRPNARTRDYTMADCVPPSMAAMVGSTPESTPGGAERFLS